MSATTPRVVVDARMLAYPLTGMGRYALELLRRITTDERWEWILLSPGPVTPELRGSIAGRTRWVEGQGKRGAEWWMQRVARRELAGSPGSVFLGLANSVPFLGPRASRTFLVVYDLTYLTVPRLTHPQDLIKGFVVNLPAILLADRLLPISSYVEQQLHRLVPRTRRGGRTVTLPLGGTNVGRGVPLAFEDRRGFLVVGAHRRKGLGVVLDAYATLPSAVRNRHPLTIVGRELPSSIRHRLSHPDLEGRVRLVLNPPDSDLIRLYREGLAHVYVSTHEGLGLPVAEALSAGLPSIVAAGTPMAAFVGGGGLVLHKPSPTAVADAMLRLASDARQWNLCAAAAADIGRSIGWGAVAAAVLEALGQRIPRP